MQSQTKRLTGVGLSQNLHLEHARDAHNRPGKVVVEDLHCLSDIVGEIECRMRCGGRTIIAIGANIIATDENVDQFPVVVNVDLRMSLHLVDKVKRLAREIGCLRTGNASVQLSHVPVVHLS